ncbi:MAG TPA: SgcJ/EcaC family oxidoreductase [Rudaea sp.]|nr:SgcJ/EcaC family oxidoreductase [Rudaea sp.]
MTATDMSIDEKAIRDLIASWLRASKSGDNETVLSLMAEDVVFLQPGQAPMRGRSGFAAAQKAMSGIDIDASSDIQEIRILGDWAWCWNRLTVVVTPRDGAPVKRAGDVLSVLQKQAGRWVIVRDANMLSRVES